MPILQVRLGFQIVRIQRSYRQKLRMRRRLIFGPLRMIARLGDIEPCLARMEGLLAFFTQVCGMRTARRCKSDQG